MKKRLQFLMRRSMAILSMLVIVLSLATVTPPLSASAVAQDCDTQFFAANDIVLYDPCAEACAPAGSGGITIEDSKDTIEAVFKFFISTPFSTNGNKPLTAVQAAAFLGNFMVESGVDPKTVQSNKAYDESKALSGVGGYALGIVQWDTDRRVALVKYAKEQHSEWSDLKTQLGFIKKELEGSEKKILSDREFKAANTSPSEAAHRVAILYERPAHPGNPLRQSHAEAIYKELKSLAPGDVEYGSGGRCSPAAGNGNIVTTATLLSYPSRKPDGFITPKPEYQKALEETGVSKLGDKCSMGGYSCDAFVATVMRYSGVDKEFSCCGAIQQQRYMEAHPEKYRPLGRITSTKGLAPGTIMVGTGSYGDHIKLYLGDGRQADASHCKRTASISDQTYFDANYYGFVAIQGSQEDAG